MDYQKRLEELRLTGEVVGKLGENEKAFATVVDAFRAQDAEAFQSVLADLGLIARCHLVCRWLCSKHCVFVCRKLAGPDEGADQLDVKEMREFAAVTARIAADDALLTELVEIVDNVDDKGFKRIVTKLKLQRYRHQLCHWLCWTRCRHVCRLMCPDPPLITKVAHIPTNQIDTQGFGAGPSIPPGHTPIDNKPQGEGDHPFGGTAHIEGSFLTVAGATHYKVEYADNPGGPWTPILAPMPDLQFGGSGLVSYQRVPDANGWYDVNDIGLLGPTQLTDWQTPGPDALYHLRLTARNGGGTEFPSALVPVLVDNTAPTPALISIKQGGHELDCCETVKEEDGPLTITVEGTDDNFSELTVTLKGGCGVSHSIFYKSYNGITTDTGAPAPGIDIVWDPWAAGIDPCCYIVEVRIWDRAIVNNSYAGRHRSSNWHSLTIA